jgi:hypothetical protein
MTGAVLGERAQLFSQAGSDPVKANGARQTAASIIRNAKALFSPRLLRNMSLDVPRPLPFDLLKWLSVYRLEQKRRTADINYEAAQESVREFRRCNPHRDPDDVFPIYSSHGAWSKARRDASRTVMKVLGDATLLLRDYYIVT